MRDLIGRTLGHYRIVEQIGGGGMGVVYRAEDTRLGREVALKFLPPEWSRDPDARKRFLREARAASALEDTRICTVHDIDETEDGQLFIAMAFYEGETLKKKVERERLPIGTAIDIAIQVAEGLERAHSADIVHRDIKPANLMLTRRDEVVIVDFGLAKLAGELSLTKSGSSLGTPHYMSPEQARGDRVDGRTDLWSLGVVLFEMLTGQRPFSGENNTAVARAILDDVPPQLADLRPEAPAELGAIVAKALEKSTEKRHQNADQLLADLRGLRDQLTEREGLTEAAPSQSPTGRRLFGSRMVIMFAVALFVVVMGTHWFRERQRERWVKDEAIPKLEEIVRSIQFLEEGPAPWDAFELARRIDEVTSGNADLEELWPRFSRELTILTDPPGAAVWVRYYGWPEEQAMLIGQTPLEGLRHPIGITRLRLELTDHRAIEDVRRNFSTEASEWQYTLHRDHDLPEEMAWIPAGRPPFGLVGLRGLEREPTTAFLMDSFEVTNGQYLRFMESGGYESPEYWRYPFAENGGELSWEEAMARFTDRTGRPGPATWEVGKPPLDSEELPVTGVSWFEAAAYAAWAGKSLPTVFHWNRVAFTPASSVIIPQGNLGSEGPIPVGASDSLNRFGVYDLAGNAREWVWNTSDRPGQRFILGGGWNDPDYAFSSRYAQLAFDRSPTNGFRCIRYLEDDSNRAALTRTIERPVRDLLAEPPVSDEVFTHFLRLFAYDRTPLEAKLEGETRARHGRRLKVSFNAAYGGERMLAYLFLPDQGRPPYQTVVIFPGSGAVSSRSSENLELHRADFVLASGRAVLYPIYKGTYERGSELASTRPEATALYRDHVIMWGKDIARSIDYLESRDDIDSSRLAYYGHSWGGRMGSIFPAIEPRFDAVILYVAGLSFSRALPEAESINYITRVTQPTLMINGKLDFYFPVETSQRPLFELLGTPKEHKRWVLYPRGHTVPRVEMIKEGLTWLDRYLGPVTSSHENTDP